MFEGTLDDRAVIERQAWKFVHRPPADGRGVTAWAQRVAGRNQRYMSHGDNASPRIAAGIAKGVKLLDCHPAQSGFLFQFAKGGVRQRFALFNKASGKSGAPAMRRIA